MIRRRLDRADYVLQPSWHTDPPPPGPGIGPAPPPDPAPVTGAPTSMHRATRRAFLVSAACLPLAVIAAAILTPDGVIPVLVAAGANVTIWAVLLLTIPECQRDTLNRRYRRRPLGEPDTPLDELLDVCEVPPQ